jgi:ferrochelatase
MGGPASQDQVGPFLSRLFADRDLIPLPAQSLLAPLIAARRTPKIKEQYAEIGGGSPIRAWTETQGNLLAALLDKESPSSAPHKAYIAFRYAEPLTAEALQEMKADGVSKAVALTLYPQYSCSTTGSSLNELHRELQTVDPEGSIDWTVIDRYASHPGLARVFARHIQEALEGYAPEERDDVVLLFSAHSLPMSVVNRGDPYPSEVAATVDQVMRVLGHSHPYRVVWQSQVGPSAWLGPKTEEVVEGYAKQGKKNLLVIPIAFVSDHIETLYELDLEYGALAKEVFLWL